MLPKDLHARHPYSIKREPLGAPPFIQQSTEALATIAGRIDIAIWHKVTQLFRFVFSRPLEEIVASAGRSVTRRANQKAFDLPRIIEEVDDFVGDSASLEKSKVIARLSNN